MGIRSLLRNLFGRSAEPNREPESSPAEQDAVPQTAKDQNDTGPTADRPAASAADERSGSAAEPATDRTPEPVTATTAAADSPAPDAADTKDATDATDATGRTESADASSGSAENRTEDDEDDEDDNRVPSPRFAADDVSRERGSRTGADDDRSQDGSSQDGGSEGGSSSGRTTSADFLDSVAGAGHDESPDPGTVEPTRPAAATAAADTSAATTAPDSVTSAVDMPEPADVQAESVQAESVQAEGTKSEATEPADTQTGATEAAKPEAAEPEAAPTAEADPAPAPEPARAEAAEPRAATVPHQASEPTEATTRATTETSENAAAVSLEKVTATAPGLISLYKAAAVSLEKRGIAGQRAAVYLVLDRSGSMRRYYKDGTVQHLAEQVLGLSAHLDDDGTVPVVFFSTEIDGSDEIDLTNYSGRVEELHASYGHMGRTNYHRAVEAVIEHYEQSGATDPALVIFQTDGAPTSRAAAEKALCDAASKPLFWQFIGFGDPKSAGLNFLRKLDSGLPVPERRAVDNAGFFHAGLEPRSLSDAELYDALTEEFPQWLEAVREAQIHA